jgi:Flp pilus assembly protein TadG
LYHDERGSVACELTLLAPALIVMLLFVVLCGRLADARLRIDDAAHQAVRAATLARGRAQADTSARSVAAVALGQAGIQCRGLAVATELHGLRPGSTVKATVTCHIGLSDLGLPGLPLDIAAKSTASSVVDDWRGVSGGTSS